MPVGPSTLTSSTRAPARPIADGVALAIGTIALIAAATSPLFASVIVVVPLFGALLSVATVAFLLSPLGRFLRPGTIAPVVIVAAGAATLLTTLT